MFRRLRAKLTVLYAGLFCLALMLIGATAYVVIADNTQKLARQQLANASRVFTQIWDRRLAHLQDAATRTARTQPLVDAIGVRFPRPIWCSSSHAKA
jgi:diguanylate cyclase